MARLANRSFDFMLLLLAIFFTISVSNAYPTLTNISKNINWSIVTDISETYQDPATGLYWTTLKINIPPGNWNSSIKNDVDGKINLKWKSDQSIGEWSIFREIYFYNNSIIDNLSYHQNTNIWEHVGPFNYNKKNNYIFNFKFDLKATVWIAFPPEPIQNRPPNRPQFNKSLNINLLAYEELWILANATDPDDDSIDLVWDWGDGASDESLGISPGDKVIRNHHWKEAGDYKITITARDSMSNNSSTINLNISTPVQPSNASVLYQPTKPKLNISSDGFLWFGNHLFISANSTDPNIDNINYSWEWGDETPPNESGPNTIQHHYYKKDGLYKINITAKNTTGINSSMVNLTVLRSKPAETPRGVRIGYVDINYTYSTGLNTSFLTPILFNWSFNDVLNSTSSSEVNHRWSSNGTKSVKARALDIQGNPGDWSHEINVDIYEPKYVECNQDLQKAIDNASNYTEIILNCNTYNVSEDILIKWKDHFAIKSRVPYVSLKNNRSVEAIMTIEKSTNINISGLSIEQSANFDNGLIALLRVADCSYCKIKDCILYILQNDSGIWVFKGGYNEIEDINIERGNTNNSFGILIEDSLSNLIKNNTFHLHVENDNFGHFVLKSPIDLNRIIKSDEMDYLKIIVDDCTFIWRGGRDNLEQRVDCPMNRPIEINNTELIFK